MFGRLLDAEPALFTRNTASSLINTLTFEVQNGANQLVYTLQSLVRDSLTTVAMLAVLLYLNWQLTIVVAVMLPAVAFVMRYYSRRLHRFTVEAQKATDDLGLRRRGERARLEERAPARRRQARRRSAFAASASGCAGSRSRR